MYILWVKYNVSTIIGAYYSKFYCPKNPMLSPCTSLPPRSPVASTDLFTVSIVLPECHVVGTIQYIAFSNLLLSLNSGHLSFLHVFSRLNISFVFSPE